ncbi:hypothetical protein ACIBKX_31870 [Streptomyces sp. NPDC050658]|uniref:hypothetical protein n=1 Tax=unclassified Streptomyces TaxID=2593676 RepID=UPI00341223D9
MGIESDQLVFDYLSRVGDLAQQRQLPSGTRMRLVTELRNEIDRSRAKAADTPVAIRRILDRLGTPEDLVDAAAGGGSYRADDVEEPPAGNPQSRNPQSRNPQSRKPQAKKDFPRPAVPTQRTSDEPAQKPKRLRRIVPRPRPAADEPEPAQDDFRPSPPHLAGTDELGPSGSEPDWWRVEPGETGPFGLADSVPGFTGGVEIPEILKPPPKKRPDDEPEEADGEEEWDEEEGEEDDDEGVEAAPRRRFRLRPAKTGGGKTGGGKTGGRRTGGGTGLSNPLLLLAAALLTVGAILGNLPALGGGWLLAYVSRRLSPAEAKWAVFGLPGLALAAGITWLWGRSDGRWGEPIRDGHMNDAMSDTWPWVLRGAAVASALFLLWRSQRQRP